MQVSKTPHTKPSEFPKYSPDQGLCQNFAKTNFFGLSWAQYRTIAAISEGLSTPEVAKKMKVGSRTTETHADAAIYRIYDKIARLHAKGNQAIDLPSKPSRTWAGMTFRQHYHQNVKPLAQEHTLEAFKYALGQRLDHNG
jgi:hypothetical protein